MNMIEVNALIFPKVFQVILDKQIPQSQEVDLDAVNTEPDLIVDLPRSAYITYLRHMASKGESVELRLLKKYAKGEVFSDADYEEAIKLFLYPGNRSTRTPSNGDIFAPFGICVTKEDGKRKLTIIPNEEQRLRAETWEYILIDILKKSAFEIVECFDFSTSFVRAKDNYRDTPDLFFSLIAWKCSSDEAEQSLSNALRSAFMFTLIGYCYGDNKSAYGSFQEFFDEEYYKRVSLVFGIWSNRGTASQIQYIPLYDSFHNLSGISKSDLIDILKAILDDPGFALDEKQMLRNRLIDGAETLHYNATPADTSLEQTLIKPAINFVLLREKSKETLETVRILCTQSQYSDCANRCYYAMMYALKALLEYKGLLADWKPNELKEPESHDLLERKLGILVSQGVLTAQDQSDFDYVKNQRLKCDYSLYKFGKVEALNCLQKAETFCAKVETLTP